VSSARGFIVDDEHGIASTLAAILKIDGYSARFFSSPAEALTAARLKDPDLLISDVAMPGISGVDLAIQLRAQYPTCKILLFVGHSRELPLKILRNHGKDSDSWFCPIYEGSVNRPIDADDRAFPADAAFAK
jgi:FixJ family two-component response regulator